LDGVLKQQQKEGFNQATFWPVLEEDIVGRMSKLASDRAGLKFQTGGRYRNRLIIGSAATAATPVLVFPRLAELCSGPTRELA